jgi:hypothetical protein
MDELEKLELLYSRGAHLTGDEFERLVYGRLNKAFYEAFCVSDLSQGEQKSVVNQ